MPNIDDNTIGQNDGGQLRHSSTKIHVELYKPLLGHKQGIYCAIETEIGIFTAGGDGAIVCWTWEQLANSPEPIGELWASIPEPIFCLLMLDDKTLVAGTQKGNLFRLSMGKPPQAIAVDSQSIYFIRYWNNVIWVGTESGRLAIFNSEFCLLQTLPISLKSLRCMETMNDLAWIGSSDAHIYHLKMVKDEFQTVESPLFRKYHLHIEPTVKPKVLVVSSHPANKPSVFGISAINENTIITVGRDAQVQLFQDSQLKSAIPAHLGTIHGLSKHTNLPWLATGSMDKSIKLWQWEIGPDFLATTQLIKVINREKFAGEFGHTNSVNSVLWISDAGKRSLLEKHNTKNFAKDPTQFHWLLSVGDDRQGFLWAITQF